MPFCTTTEAASILGVSVATVQLWVESGLLEAWKTAGGHRRILRESVSRLVYSQSGSTESASDNIPGKPGRLRVMVMEDDPDLLRLYGTQLKFWPMEPEVTLMENAIAALLMIGRAPPDLLIADLHMPGVDGFSVLRILQRTPELAGVKIVVVSGLDPEAIADRGGIAPGIELLSKPIPFERLQAIASDMQAARLQPLHAGALSA
jgi:excisionase family DNA binding protein